MNIFKDNFSIDRPENFVVFKQSEVPIFQNKVYAIEAEALKAPIGEVELVQSLESGFIFNRKFDPVSMDYDMNYQNEQANSLFFQQHLNGVLDLLKSLGIQRKKVVEIGCGKGGFFEMMLKDGIDCIGFDPTYEGTNPRIIKEYFSEKHKGINADVIILRHTMEHIQQPFSFIHAIAKANDYKGFLFVEVPSFDWIVEKNAFWDIFYEHCNYFTEESLSVMFDEAVTNSFFGGQYIYLWADLSKLKFTIPDNQPFKERKDLLFSNKLDFYKTFLKENQSMVVWGAGAKGSTFLNLLDKDKALIKYVIDINPVKQNRYIAGTGHKIYSPDILQQDPPDNILVMNELYLAEIKSSVNNTNINFFHL